MRLYTREALLVGRDQAFGEVQPISARPLGEGQNSSKVRFLIVGETSPFGSLFSSIHRQPSFSRRVWASQQSSTCAKEKGFYTFPKRKL